MSPSSHMHKVTVN